VPRKFSSVSFRPFGVSQGKVLSMRKIRAALIAMVTIFLGASSAAAQESKGESDSGAKPARSSAAWDANTGLIPGLALVLVAPPEGPVGAGAMVHGRYGIPAGPLVLAPGAQLGGFVVQRRFIGNLLGTFRVTLPVGPLAPYVKGGLGPGIITNPREVGLAWMGGGGLMIHFWRAFALGADVSYQTITGTDFGMLTIGPSIRIGG
jgi:hypothetical protein